MESESETKPAEKLDKVTVQKLVRDRSSRVSFDNKTAGSSQFWNNFVKVNVDNTYSEYVKCIKCDTIVKYSARDGTGGMASHSSSCLRSATANSSKITDFPGWMKKGTSKSLLPSTLKSEVADELAMMCAKDIRPFAIVDGEGFRAFVQKILDIGAKYGNVDLNDILPHSTTIARHAQVLHSMRKAEVSTWFIDIPSFGVTCDSWTHMTTNTEYLTTTVHYIDNEWNIKSNIIATLELNESKTADMIRENVFSILDEHNCRRSSNTFITDNAANMKAAFRHSSWIGCAAHNLNLAVAHGLEQNADESQPSAPAEVIQLINTAKQLVTLVKRTKINNQLESTLKQCVPTRWNSILTMLVSVEDNAANLRTIASESTNRNVMRLLADINENVLAETISILQAFDDATRILSAENTPTLHLVLPTKHQLLQHLRPVSSDSAIASQLKEVFAAKLEQYFLITPKHLLATFLDPRLKANRNLMGEDVRTDMIASLKQLVANVQVTAVKETQQAVSGVSVTDIKAKRTRHENASSSQQSFFGDLFVQSEHNSDEVDSYVVSAEVCEDVLQYWKQKQSVYPKLATVVRATLGTPATSTPSERAFSLAGRTLEDRRSSLSPSSVDTLLFLHGLK
jgi:hypothetical protein